MKETYKYLQKQTGEKENSDIFIKDGKNTCSSNMWTCYKHFKMFYKM